MSPAEKSTSARAAQILEFQITLQDIEPPIWRRFQVQDSTSLDTLHEIVQTVMGWQGEHMHEFVWGATHYGVADPDFGADFDDEEKATLRKLGMKVDDVLGYVYDFGDDWRHDIVLQAVLAPAPGVKYPICLDGERACPPEDCGSIPGYENIVRILALPAGKRTDDDLEMLDWLGDEYDPESFDVDEVNANLAQFFQTRKVWTLRR